MQLENEARTRKYIEVMRMACDLHVNSDLTNFFVQNIDEIEIVVEKKLIKAKRNGESVSKKCQCLEEVFTFPILLIYKTRSAFSFKFKFYSQVDFDDSKVLTVPLL